MPAAIKFLNHLELYDFLKKDADGYYSTFSPTDLHVRKVASVDEYINNNISKSVGDFSEEEKEKIRRCIRTILPKINAIQFPYFDGHKCNAIPWNIGCMTGNLYEAGLPHTREDIIILPKEAVRINHLGDTGLEILLFHEKIHVYQKMYPQDMSVYLNNNQFIKMNKKMDVNGHINYRANPDLDEWIYYDAKNKRKIGAIYNDQASSIMDVKFAGGNDRNEHPFEQMAYEFANANGAEPP